MMIKPSIPVFCYHNVSDVDGHTPELFGKHLDAMLDAGYRTLTASELMAVVRGEKPIEPKTLALTFDDGHLSNWTVVMPELVKRGMTATFFVLGEFTKEGRARDEKTAPALKSMPDSFRDALYRKDYSQFMNMSELKGLMDRGMEVHSHGVRHQPAFRTMKQNSVMGDSHSHWGAWGVYSEYDSKLPVFDVASAYVFNGFWPVEGGRPGKDWRVRTDAERLAFLREDFAASLEFIRELTGRDEQYFCWPWGHFDDVSRIALKQAGFSGAFTLERRANVPGTDPFRIHRIGVGKSKNAKWIKSRLRMYGHELSANFCFKLFRKKPDVRCVLYATDSAKLSGGSRQMLNNIIAMERMGVRTVAVVHPDSALVPALRETGCTVVPFDGFRKYFSAARFLKKMVATHGVDVVHTFHNRAYKMGAMAKLLGAKFRLFVNRGVVSRPNDVFFLWTANADGVICNSMKCAEVLRKHRVSKKRLNVVYNAYAGPDFGDPEPRKKRGLRILYVGNGAHIKGFDTFLKGAEAFCENGEVRDVEFVGVGIREDEQPAFLEGISPEVKNRLSLPGILPHAEVLEQIRTSDMLVVSSRKESLPNTLIEAFDAGLPVVCTRAGGIPEIVHDGLNGFLAEIEDAAALGKGMRALAEDWDLRQRMGRINRRIVRELMDVNAKGRALMRVYQGERLHSALPVEDMGNGAGKA